MDSLVSKAQLKALTANSVTKNLAVNLIEAIGSVLDKNSKEKLNNVRFESIRKQLFLKFTMIDYESILNDNIKLDQFNK